MPRGLSGSGCILCSKIKCPRYQAGVWTNCSFSSETLHPLMAEMFSGWAVSFCGDSGRASKAANIALQWDLQRLCMPFKWALKPVRRASVAVQRLRIHLPMQEIWVPSLDWEDSTGQLSLCATAKPTLWRPRAATEHASLEPLSLEPDLRRRCHRNKKPTHPETGAPTRCKQEKPTSGNKDPAQAKNYFLKMP